jgi:hypothetical protein
MTANHRDPSHALLRNLTRELFQTEVSASLHARREARRQPGTAPANALLAVARHADLASNELWQLARKHDLPRSSFGMLLGLAFSEARQRIADHFIDAERSYRGTLLGMRHGSDLMRIFEATAEHVGREELVSWARSWLAIRDPLVKEAERELAWYATRARRALARAH